MILRVKGENIVCNSELQGECVDSTWRSVQIHAAWVLAQTAHAPRHLIELILKVSDQFDRLLRCFTLITDTEDYCKMRTGIFDRFSYRNRENPFRKSRLSLS